MAEAVLPASLCTSNVQVSHFQPSCVAQGASTAICPSFIGSNVRDVNINISLGSHISKDGSNCGDADHSVRLKPHYEFIDPQAVNQITDCQQKLKETLRKKFSHLREGITAEASRTSLNRIYTELYITQGGSGGVNTEHEVRQIEVASWLDTSEKSIHCSQLFVPDEGQDLHVRTVVTRGMAGIGKTVSVSKFTLDWAEGRESSHLDFVFPLSFRELNLMKKSRLSLVGLLATLFPEITDLGIFTSSQKMLFILDGLDESRLPLNFRKDHILTDVYQEDAVAVLLTNLIRGRLLPSAHIWITTRPAAFCQIPIDFIHLVTDVRGFNDDQKDEYFRRKISDQSLANKIISHVKACRSLYIMCHIPLFCWMAVKVLQRKLAAEGDGDAMPKTLTQMYIYFLSLCVDDSRKRLSGRKEADTAFWRENLMSLGELAFRELLKGHLIFYEKDLAQSGIKLSEALMFSGVYTQIFNEEISLCKEKMFCFVHLSIQEFLAALYVFLTFHNNNYNVLIRKSSASKRFPFGDSSELILYKAAVQKALQSQNGHLNIFLRFLLGLSLESNQDQLKHLMTNDRSKQQTRGEIIIYIKEKIRNKPSSDTCLNLFHCLNELNDCSLMEEIQVFLKSESLEKTRLSPTQWATLVFVLLTSEKDLSVFQLSHYRWLKDALQRLLPVVKMAQVANLAGCQLTVKSCEILENAVASSHLTELYLNNNNLTDKGVLLLSGDLKTSKIHTLSLRACNLTHKCCDALASVISSSTLKSLDLSDNDIQDEGVIMLCIGLQSPKSALEKLGLSLCRLTELSCNFLAPALHSSTLRELDLSYNHPGYLGMEFLSALVEDTSCQLEKLRFDHCDASRLQPSPRKYHKTLTLEPNSAHPRISLSNDGTSAVYSNVKTCTDDPERFQCWSQVLCSEELTGCCSWEVKWIGRVCVGVAYRRMKRKGDGYDSWLGKNTSSWGLSCSYTGYQAWHGNICCKVSTLPRSELLVVFLDYPSGTLSFYMVVSKGLILLHTFRTTFTEPLLPGFWLGWVDSSVSLCNTSVNGPV